jgi:hypothetical protein
VTSGLNGNCGVPARRSASQFYDYELQRLPAPAHQPFDSLRWSHPTKKLTASKRQQGTNPSLTPRVIKRRLEKPAQKIFDGLSMQRRHTNRTSDKKKHGEIKRQFFPEVRSEEKRISKSDRQEVGG